MVLPVFLGFNYFQAKILEQLVGGFNSTGLALHDATQGGLVYTCICGDSVLSFPTGSYFVSEYFYDHESH